MKVKKSKAIAIFLAAFMAVSCTACGTGDTSEPTDSTKGITEETTETTESTEGTDAPIIVSNESLTETATGITQAVSEIATDIITTDTSEPAPSLPPSNTISGEEAMEIARKAYEALVSNDYAAAVRYTNLDLFYYLANGEWGTEDVMVAELEAAKEEGMDTTIVDFSVMENLQFTNVETLSDEELKEYNDFIPKMIEEQMENVTELDSSDYTLEGAYKVYFTYDGLDEDMTEYEVTEQPHFLVVNARGEWKADLCLATMKQLYGMIDELQPTEVVDPNNN